jgi:diketogulonate reductase-like aldo/keto reductase
MMFKLGPRLFQCQILLLLTALAHAEDKCLLQVGTKLHGYQTGVPDTIELKAGSEATGLKMPVLGFGTCCRHSSRGPALKKSIAAYIEHGGRLIDTAVAYHNHKDVGDALQSALQSGSITREQIWVTSKIAPSQASTESDVKALLDESLRDLQLDYVDLLLIHAPGENSLALWKGFIEAKASGKTKAIGVSNFKPDQIEELTKAGLEQPSVNQIEFHPWVQSKRFDTVKWCLGHGVAVTAYGSIGSSYHDGLSDPKVQEVAQKHSKTAAQVLLSWALHQGVAVVPGATSEKHIAEDLEANSFDLDSDEADLHFFGQASKEDIRPGRF